jgi:diamine N-acetyltransferase
MLQSSSVFLRALEPEDLELLYTIENDTTVWSVSSERSHYSKFALKQYLASQPANIFQQGELRLVICESLTNKSVGLIDLTNFSPIDRRAEISICLLDDYRGRGYAKDAIVGIEKYAAEVLRLDFLYAQVSKTTNPASMKLFESLAYAEVAVLPAWHYGKNGHEDLAILKKKL